MALEFPSWLEWLEWLVGSDWPHGNEDLMWQMARDFDVVAGQVDDLISDLDHLMGQLGDAYPEGTGGEKILKWLEPLRDGEGPEKHGSLKELGDNYRGLGTAADGLGDQLQSAKLNFYIAGVWLIGELAWAAASGPFAPALEGTIFATARIAFRELGERLANRIVSAIEQRITNAMLRRLLPKLIYEIGQEALVEAFQGTAQEFLVETIQQETGHTDGYNWGAIGDNAAISAIAGGAGGAVGLGANHFLPTDAGRWRGMFNGALTGITAGAGGAGAAWLAGGLLDGNWEFDPRSLTGGALSGAGPSAMHGWGGNTDHGGRPVGSHPVSDGTMPSTREATAPTVPDVNADTHRPTTDPVGNGQQPGTDPAHNGQQQGGAPTHPGGDSTQPGGAPTHPASAPVTDADPGIRSESHAPSDTRDESAPTNGQDAPGGGGGRHGKPDVDPNAVDGGGDSMSSHRSDTAPSSDRPSDTHGDDTGSNSDHRTESRPDARDAGTDTSSENGSHAKSDEAGVRHEEPNSEGKSTHPAEATNPGPAASNGPIANPGAQPGAAPTHAGPNTGTNPNTSAGPNTSASDTRTTAPSDAAKPGPAARPTMGGDGTAPKPIAAQPSTAARGSIGDLNAAGPLQASTTGSEVPIAHTAADTENGAVPEPAAGPEHGVDPKPGVDSEHEGFPERGFLSEHGTDPPLRDGTEHPADAEHRSGREHPENSPTAGIAPIVDLPGSRPDSRAHDSAARPGDRDRQPVPDRGTASPVGDFHGDARPAGPDLTQDQLIDQIKANLGLVTPEDVSWNRDEEHFVLPDGHGTVKITVADDVLAPSGDGERSPVAEIIKRPDGPGYDVHVSPRARNEDVVRAVAHELAEIRLSTDPEIQLDPAMDPNADRPSQLTPHLGGRFAEIQVLTSEIDRAAADPARAKHLPQLRNDLHTLTEQLGFNDPAHADTVRQLLEDRSPELARRLELEQQGINAHRPVFDPNLSNADFDQAAADHIQQLRQLLDGDHADAVVRSEEQALDGRMREELARRVFDPLFDPSTKPARGLVKLDDLLSALNPVNAAMNDPVTRGPDRAEALHRAIDEFADSMPQNFRDALGPDVLAHMHDAADAFAAAPDHITGVLDHQTGQLTVNGEPTTLSDFLTEVDRANRGATAHGLNTEYTVVVHDPVDGKSTVEILSRPRPMHRLPLAQNVFGEGNQPIPPQPRPSLHAAVAGGHTIDVGVGRSAFAVDLTPVADRSGGGLIIKTELASEFPVKGQRRRDLGILDPGPLTEPGTVMLFGDLLFNGHLLGDGGPGQVARIYINNVSADLPDSAYHAIAARLAATLAPGGRVEVQWDMKPEKANGRPGDRNHILGTKLWDAIDALYEGRTNPFRVAETTRFPHPGNTDYDYTIDAGASNNLNTARMAGFSRPLPEHRMVIVYEPEGHGAQPHSVDAPAIDGPVTEDVVLEADHDGIVLFEGNLPEGGEPLYRGIARLLPDGSINPAYTAGLAGIVEPRGTRDLDYEGHTSHLGSASDATSWSRSRSTAAVFAGGHDGLIMEWRTGRPPEDATWRFKPIYDLDDGFAQVLIQGTLTDARAVRFLPDSPAPDLAADEHAPESAPADPEHGTASPVGEFHGDARPDGTPDLTPEFVLDRIENNVGLITPEGVVWNSDTNQFELTRDGRTLPINVDVGPTTDNAVADFTARTDDSGNVTGYDVNVSPRARDQDVLRAVAHEVAEIRLSQDDDIRTDPHDDRPSDMTSHLGGRFAEMRVLAADIDAAMPDRARQDELPGLRQDLRDLMVKVGLHDPEHAPTVERLLAEHDPDLARRIDQARIPDPAMLRPGPIDPDAVPTPHDLGRIRQLRELAEQSERLAPAVGQTDPAARRAYDANRREALALVERLGLREGTPGAAERRAIVADRLNEHTRGQVDDLLADVGRRESDLSESDRQLADRVRIEARAADALDLMSQPFHKAVLKAHQAYRAQLAENAGAPIHVDAGRTTPEGHRIVADNIVEDAESGDRWYRWPLDAEISPASTSFPDIGLPVDPEQLHEHWADLSDAEKDALHRQDPFIGNRDGVPQLDRDHYNRLTLDMLREQAEREHNEDRLKQIDDMKKFLDTTVEGDPPHLLSYVDEKLQYVYALGNPDTADNVAMGLAGAFRRRSGVGYALQTLRQLRQAALRAAPTKETSVLLFGAYNNPDSLVATISSRGAEEGAQKVREFHDGLRVTHQGPPANMTTIAHSYGGVTGGHSAGHGHELNTDALVFIGSWGTGVASVADLRLTGVDPADIGDHVFATMAAHDSILLMPANHGPAPTDPAFGATVFETDSTPSQTRLGWNPDDHLATNYFDSRNRSFRALGRIIAGFRPR